MPKRLTRREFLSTAGAASVVLAAGCSGSDDQTRPTPTITAPVADSTARPLSARFAAGVASGEVGPDRAVLWTHIAELDELRGQLAADPAFNEVIAEAEVQAALDWGLTAHWAVDGLEPGVEYHYRFLTSDGASPSGRFRCAPADDDNASFRFAISGDSDGTRDAGEPSPYGGFQVLNAVLADKPEFFLYIGDTIYSDSGLRAAPALTIDEYRGCYLENRTYQPLADLLAGVATFAMFDDHEVMNDFDGQTVDSARYAAGYRAFRDFFPLGGEPARWSATTRIADAPVAYRNFRWGAAAEFFIVDTRSFRSADAEPACQLPDGSSDLIPALGTAQAPDAGVGVRRVIGHPEQTSEACLRELASASKTVLGDQQKAWLFDGLRGSDATFKFVVTGEPIQQFFAQPYDRWEGFESERRELLEFIRDERIRNVIFLTTDLHGNLVNEVSPDYLAGEPPVAVEVVTGPIGTNTFATSIANLGGPELVDAFRGFASSIAGTRCLELDVYSYALLEVDAEGPSVTASIKDERGATLYSETIQAAS
jgi:phosphodiesterase/alkaline phosphatase D-like protein